MEKRAKKTLFTSIIGTFSNIFLMTIKGIIGFMTNSQAMIADTMNSAGDILSSIITFIGVRISSKPRDEDHNLGHGKAEYIYSMIISMVIIIIAFKTMKSSIVSLIEPTKYTFSIWLVIVCLITIMIKLGLFIYTNRIYKKYHNLMVKAASKDHLGDCFITSVNLVASLLSLKGIYYFDGIVGILISIWMIYSAFDIFKESYDILMDKAIDNSTKEEVLKLVKKHPEVLKINHFNATPVGYQYQISFTIFVDGNLSTFESHEIADNLEDEIDEAFPEIYLTVIHVNPMNLKDKF